MSKQDVLHIDNVTMRFGGLTAVDHLDLKIREDEVVGLIGPNGAGKTTVFNCVTQFYDTYEGSIKFTNASGETVDLKNHKVTEVINLGIVRTFQNIELIPDLSVMDNVLIGAHNQFKTGIIQHLFRTKKVREEEAHWREEAEEILEFMGIPHLKDAMVKGQPYGILKKIEIARTLISRPRLIILDEPAAGLNEYETEELRDIINKIRKNYKASILLIEHDMGFVMNICDRVAAINFGKNIATDTPKKIQSHPKVQEAYLGNGDA
ncbi:MAG: ABC transporter ATP-binding protein [Candidatus Izemoplasmataceae bacterium]